MRFAGKNEFLPRHFPHQVSLVNINIVAFPDLRKGLDSDGVSSLLHGNDNVIPQK